MHITAAISLFYTCPASQVIITTDAPIYNKGFITLPGHIGFYTSAKHLIKLFRQSLSFM
jgi:hypothetical protein